LKVEKGLKRIANLCVLKNDNKFLLLKRLKEPNKNKYTPVYRQQKQAVQLGFKKYNNTGDISKIIK
jgi:hypothetical protein